MKSKRKLGPNCVGTGNSGLIRITGTSEIARTEQVVPSKRQCIRHFDSRHVFGFGNQGSEDFGTIGNAVNITQSHEFTATDESNIVLHETADRNFSIKRQRICEPNSQSTSEPERFVQVVLAFFKVSGLLLAMLVNQRALHMTDNVNVVDVSSFGGCVPGAKLTGEYSTRTTTSMDNVNVPTVSFRTIVYHRLMLQLLQIMHLLMILLHVISIQEGCRMFCVEWVKVTTEDISGGFFRPSGICGTQQDCHNVKKFQKAATTVGNKERRANFLLL